MLKQRIITALILIPLFVLFVLKAPATWFCLITAVLVLVGAWEWTRLMGVTSFRQAMIYLIIMTILIFLALYLQIPTIEYVAAFWWIVATGLVIFYPKIREYWGNSIIKRGAMGVLVLIPCWLAINFIRNTNGPYDLLFLCVLIWGADSAAYFAGRKWGKHKLAPEVSPGKTVEGFYGAMAMTVLISLIALYLSHTPYTIWVAGIVLSLITVMFSIVGDLFESMLKRNVGLKDSGTIIPGHGGILDRIDSLTAAAPIYVVGSFLISKLYY